MLVGVCVAVWSSRSPWRSPSGSAVGVNVGVAVLVVGCASA
ncbi:MAG: hypothetical protein U0802_14295 [Candidatus Binatia bacterium]